MNSFLFEPDVSFIIATHNRADLLPKAVGSLLRQTIQDFEIILVDDASRDDTQKVIQGLTAADQRIHCLRSEKNIGPGAARNLGIAAARGKFIAVMDDDDISLPERLELQVGLLENNPKIDLVFSAVEWVNDRLETIQLFPDLVLQDAFPQDPQEIFRLLYLESNKIPNTTIMARKELFESFQYPEHPWIGEDWFLCMQVAASGILIKALASPLVRMNRGHDGQRLMNNSKGTLFKCQRQVLAMIRDWLNQQDIHTFDTLHNLALANQIIRESRHFVGIKGLLMIFQAFLLCPSNPKIQDNLEWYLHKGQRGMKLITGRSPGT